MATPPIPAVPPAPLRLLIDGAALVANWRLLDALSGTVACGAAVKADGYGLGAREVVRRLAAAGCRDVFVATWAEAAAVADLGVAVSVLHGVRDEDMATARALPHVRPVLNTPRQVARWREHAPGRACDLMVDTGMHRLGLDAADIDAAGVAELRVDTLMTHLASADEDSAQNHDQLSRFRRVAAAVACRRRSIANSAGILLGADYHLDLVRPGIALYGGEPVAALAGRIRPVVRPAAQVLQRRHVPAGGAVGYNATWRAPVASEIAVVNIGYADGFSRNLSNAATATACGVTLPVVGRVSMDLVAVDCTALSGLAEGDWISFDFALPTAAATSGLSQYELLTRLGSRFERRWT